MTAIIDYGVGNLASVRNAFERLGLEAVIVEQPERLDSFDRAILPGVGSFRVAMETLQNRGWIPAIKAYAASARPFLGICLGMQLLFDRGEEHGPTAGLGLIPGDVVKLQPAPPNRVPHVGWNNFSTLRPHPLFKGVKPEVDFYYVHSFHCIPASSDVIVGTCDFGGEFVSVVSQKNVAGMQFHPEKSQPAGMKVLDNFSQWVPAC
jgi:imidazole glycerol-phosphate synthase subunit HisH